MKIRAILSLLCCMTSLAVYAQSEDNCQWPTHNSQLIKLHLSESKDCLQALPSIATSTKLTHNSELHRVPPRREIRHKLKQLTVNGQQPEDNCQFSIVNSQLSTRASGEYIMKEFPTMGEVRGLVLLVAYKDVAFCLPDDSIRTLLQARYDGNNYTEYIEHQGYSEVDGDSIAIRATIPGSARDYFRDQSFGQFTPRFDVVGPITLDNPRAHYGANNSSGGDKNASAMVTEACRKVYEQQLVDLSDYDGDGDGVVDFVYVVYAGSDEAQTSIEECVWAHAHTVSFTLGDMKIGRYACSGELFVDLKGLPAGIGTFVHEFSHILGLPDFYNTKADDFTMDVWSVMDYGMYNRGGFVPCAYTAFERYSLGWIPMHTLDTPTTMSIGTTDEEGKGYRIFTSDLEPNTLITEDDTASFYLVETIRKEGWNRYAYAEGLLISEVTYEKSAWTSNKVNVGTHRHCIVPADNAYSYKTANKHLFGTENHEFTRNSTPASVTQFGASMDKPLTDIRYDKETGKTSFDFCGGEPENPEGPNDTTGIVHEGRVQGSISYIHYDLQGRPVKKPSKGIYIVDGKKVMIK